MFLFIFILCLFALWGVYFLSPVSVFLYCDDLSSDILCRQLRFLCLALLGRSKRRPGGQTRSMLMRRIMMMVIRMWLIEESDCSRLIPMYCTYYLEVMHLVAVSSVKYRHMGFLYFYFLAYDNDICTGNVVFWYLTHAQGLLVSAGAARFVCLLAGWKLRRWIAFQTKSASRRPTPGFGGPAEYSAEY